MADEDEEREGLAEDDEEEDATSDGSEGTKSPLSKNTVFLRTWISGSLRELLRISQPVLLGPVSPRRLLSSCLTAGALCLRRPEIVYSAFERAASDEAGDGRRKERRVGSGSQSLRYFKARQKLVEVGDKCNLTYHILCSRVVLQSSTNDPQGCYPNLGRGCWRCEETMQRLPKRKRSQIVRIVNLFDQLKFPGVSSTFGT